MVRFLTNVIPAHTHGTPTPPAVMSMQPDGLHNKSAVNCMRRPASSNSFLLKGQILFNSALVAIALGAAMATMPVVLPLDARAQSAGPTAQPLGPDRQPIGPTNIPQTTRPPGIYRYPKPGQPTVMPPHITYSKSLRSATPRGGSTVTPSTIPNTTPLSWHNGWEMTGGTYAFNIFWEPYNPSSYSWYNWRMNVFFGDINQTNYYGDLTQYSIQNSSQLAAGWQDTQVFPRTNLTTTDIMNEVDRAIQVNNWSVDSTSQINVIIGDGANIGTGDCGYHTEGTTSPGGFQVAFTAIGYNVSGCNAPQCPNRCDVDQALDTLSHETFEVTTDPFDSGWWNNNIGSINGEIGDVCNGSYGTLQYNGTANQSWNGRYYILQEEWDNAATNQGTGGNCTTYGP